MTLKTDTTTGAASITTATTTSGSPLSATKTEINMHDFENEEGVERLDAALTSRSILTLKTDTTGAASTTIATATRTHPCGSSLSSTQSEMNDLEKEKDADFGSRYCKFLVA
ncbi:hypothetical protein TrLO_g11989 [Triparma laevis f. longispina]|uniref:Uncharacterized protein n=1 Tax=Triparma laevis f. longispina TaxID=1714387 RepID=A0A9W7CKG6_9STRA|nr:hypothetical protein TrLO_g11989 [Triparma laevis f. longispina]